jgi:Carboxypeptidase regulatory-like domain
MRWMTLLCCVAAVLAQSGRGTIQGRVFDQDQAVVGAPVEAKNIETGTVYKATSSANGSYSIEEVPAGNYEVTISVGGFEKKDTTVEASHTSSADFRFEPGFQLGTLGDGDIYSLIARLPKRPPPAGPTPRTAGGKPDLSGVWRAPSTIDSNEPELLPAAQKLLNQRFANNGLDSPAVRCMPDAILRLTPFFKLLQTATVLMVVIEAETPGYYQVFLDGRGTPKDPNPTWYGHASGKWDGNTLVVDTIKFNDRRWLTVFGTPISEKLHVTERFRRPDLGHLQIETTIDDPGIYPKPWIITRVSELAPDEEIIESICNENNKDPQHMLGK